MLARVALLLAITVAAGCQGTATQTSPIFRTDTLTGVVVTGAPGFHIVKTGQPSSVSLGLTSLDPNTGVSVGIGLGTPPSDGSASCAVQVFQTIHMGESFQISGVPASTFCVEVFEFGTGSIPDPLNYVVTFNHH